MTKTKKFPKLTEMERKVLKALYESAMKATGGEFGFIEEARGVVGVDQLAGVVASLVKKDIINVYPPERTNGVGPVYTQFTFKGEDGGWGMLERVGKEVR